VAIMKACIQLNLKGLFMQPLFQYPDLCWAIVLKAMHYFINHPELHLLLTCMPIWRLLLFPPWTTPSLTGFENHGFSIELKSHFHILLGPQATCFYYDYLAAQGDISKCTMNSCPYATLHARRSLTWIKRCDRYCWNNFDLSFITLFQAKEVSI
jgi:hypothetical protein